MNKQIIFIRHGYALHNDLFWKLGKKAYSDYVDTPLLNRGFSQAYHCREMFFKEINQLGRKPDIVLVSPLTRTLQTAMCIFSDDIKIKALDCLVEYPQGGFEKCNIRKERKMLETVYPSVDFTQIEQNMLWSQDEESIGELNGRISKLWDYIGKMKEKLIVVVSHSSYIGQLKDKKIGDEKNELKHCYPYLMTAEYDDEKNFIKAYELTNHKFEEMTEE
jgi:broad specificity phosphatase PhoE